MTFRTAGAAEVLSFFRHHVAKICTIALLASGIVISSAEGLDKVRIAVSNPNMPNLTVAMAQQKGFFKDENIEAEIIRMNPNVAVTALATGDIDYCQLFGAVVGGAIAGLPIRIVAGYLDNWPMTLIAQPEFKTLKDLKGKTLGISSFGATPDLAARMMLKQVGIDPEKEIKILALGSDAARLTALKQRVVDLIVISPPADTQMEKQGYKIMARAYELFSFPYLGLGTHMRKSKKSLMKFGGSLRQRFAPTVSSETIATRRYGFWRRGAKTTVISPMPRMMLCAVSSMPTAPSQRTDSSSLSSKRGAAQKSPVKSHPPTLLT